MTTQEKQIWAADAKADTQGLPSPCCCCSGFYISEFYPTAWHCASVYVLHCVCVCVWARVRHRKRRETEREKIVRGWWKWVRVLFHLQGCCDISAEQRSPVAIAGDARVTEMLTSSVNPDRRSADNSVSAGFRGNSRSKSPTFNSRVINLISSI